MLALEHLHATALLYVLVGAALALLTLRAAVYLSRRALVARDRAIIAAVTASSPRAHDDRQLP
jgi:hypothetical protein